jgi:pSer/pThr/pTyr-binding forkhead associated (FHA) protein
MEAEMAGKFQFVMRSGPTVGAIYPLDGELISIGRDASNTIQINDAEVSRRHARLQFQGGKYVIADVGSTNGTHVNGQRIESSCVLKPSDVVSFGEGIVLAYESTDFDPAATLAVPRAGGQQAPRQPVAAPSPVQAYAGQVAASPMPVGKKINPLPIVIGVGVLLFICACGIALWLVDSANLWCTLFPGLMRMFGLYCP